MSDRPHLSVIPSEQWNLGPGRVTRAWELLGIVYGHCRPYSVPTVGIDDTSRAPCLGYSGLLVTRVNLEEPQTQ